MHYSKEGKYFRESDVRPNMHDFNAYLREKGKTEFRESPHSAKNVISAVLILATIIDGILLCFFGFSKYHSCAYHTIIMFCVLISLTIFVNTKNSDPEAPKINLFRLVSGICFLIAAGGEVSYIFYQMDYIQNPASVIMMIISATLFLAGVITVIATLVWYVSLKKNCTVELQATCIGFDDVIRTSGSENHQHSFLETCPVYQFTYGGREYMVYDGYYEEDEFELPRVGDVVEVKISPEDPNKCIINGKNSIRLGILIAGVCMVAVSFIILGASMAVKEDMAKDKRKEINDALIAAAYHCSEDEVPEYIVFERVVIDVSGNQYYFEETSGLPYGVISNDTYEVNEHVYWVEVPGKPAMLCDMDDYRYAGDQTPEHSSRYSQDGKCYITDQYVKERYDSDTYDIVTVSFQQRNGDKLSFVAANGECCSIRIPAERLRYYENTQYGDTYYWMKLEDGQVDLLDAKLYIYEE